jgi:hypothetical protein
MRLLFFNVGLLLLIQFAFSCETKNGATKNTTERFPFITDSVPDFELMAKQLKDTSKETVTYELSVLNHTLKTRNILFYKCDINYGIHCTGGSIVPQSFQCNANIPYSMILLANDKLTYHLKVYRKDLDNPKFYWRLIEIDQMILENQHFIVLDTIHLETP